MLDRISYITLWVTAYDNCLAFYRDNLGLPLDGANESFAKFAAAGRQLYLHRMGSSPPLRARALEIHFEVSDVDSVYEDLVRKGVRFESAPADMRWGRRMAAFRDPEGNAIEVVGPPRGNGPQPNGGET